jgi:hypothetical protein
MPAWERVAGRLARELNRSGIGSHARALRIVDALIAMDADPQAAPPVSGSGRSRAVATAR